MINDDEDDRFFSRPSRVGTATWTKCGWGGWSAIPLPGCDTQLLTSDFWLLPPSAFRLVASELCYHCITVWPSTGKSGKAKATACSTTSTADVTCRLTPAIRHAAANCHPVSQDWVAVIVEPMWPDGERVDGAMLQRAGASATWKSRRQDLSEQRGAARRGCSPGQGKARQGEARQRRAGRTASTSKQSLARRQAGRQRSAEQSRA